MRVPRSTSPQGDGRGERARGRTSRSFERGDPLPGLTRKGAPLHTPERKCEGEERHVSYFRCAELWVHGSKPARERGARPHRIAARASASAVAPKAGVPGGSENPRGATERGESASGIDHRRAALPAHEARRVCGLRSRLPPRFVPRVRSIALGHPSEQLECPSRTIRANDEFGKGSDEVTTISEMARGRSSERARPVENAGSRWSHHRSSQVEPSCGEKPVTVPLRGFFLCFFCWPSLLGRGRVSGPRPPRALTLHSRCERCARSQ